MSRNRHQQLDFFTQGHQNKGDKENISRSSVYETIRRYEKGLLIAIGFVITASIAYTVGMRHGRQAADAPAPETTAALPLPEDMPAEQQLPEAVEPVAERALAEAADAPAAAPVEKVPIVETAQESGYTIQLAAYAQLSYAEREAEKLKKNGYTPIIRKSGEYVVLSVGRFATKEAAQRIMKAQFEKKYEGCYTRRL